MRSMRHVDLDHISPGMVNGRHVYAPGETKGLPLLAANVVITEAIRDKLVKSGIVQILVDDDISRGIEPTPPITEETRRAALGTVRDTFQKLAAPEASMG